MEVVRQRILYILFTALIFGVCHASIAVGQTEPAKPSTRPRRALYNFDGDSTMFTRAGGKGPVALTAEDLRRAIQEVAYDGSKVDTILVCVNAQVMYYPTKVGTQRGLQSTPDERAPMAGISTTDVRKPPAILFQWTGSVCHYA